MRIFVYGTLKRGGRLHEYLAGQRFLGEAVTRPDYRLHRVDWFPGLVEVDPATGVGVAGEVWEVDDAGLTVLDEVEETASGLFQRRPVRLAPPFDREPVEAWFYSGDMRDCPDCGTCW